MRENKKTLQSSLFLGLLVMLYSSSLWAQTSAIISAIDSNSSGQNVGVNSDQSNPNSFVALDFSVNTAESWDAKGKPKNIIAHCLDGTTITGFEYINVTIQTVGGSFFSEAVIYFSDSNGDGGLKLKVGSNTNSSGTQAFNSNGILDITDSGNQDIHSLADNQFITQFFEEIDDVNDAIDARFTNGILKVWGVDLVASNECPFIASVAPADLAVEYSTTQNNNEVGDALDFNIVINNNGGSEASNVKLQSSISDNLTFLGLTCDDGTSVADVNNIASVNVTNILANGMLTCDFNTEINATGDIAFNVSVSTDSEPNVADNSASFVLLASHVVVVPINNAFALLLLGLFLLFFVKRFGYLK